MSCAGGSLSNHGSSAGQFVGGGCAALPGHALLRHCRTMIVEGEIPGVTANASLKLITAALGNVSLVCTHVVKLSKALGVVISPFVSKYPQTTPLKRTTAGSTPAHRLHR